MPRNEPCQPRGGECDHHYPCSPSVGEFHDFGFARVCRLHKTDHPLNGAVLADLGRLHLKCTELIHRAAGHRVADCLINRQGFTRHDRLVDRGQSRYDPTVNGNALTRQHSDMISDLDMFGGNDLFLAVAQDPRGLRCQVHKFFNTCARPCHCQLFKQCAELHDDRDFSRREILSDANRCNKRKRHKHIRFDVKLGDKTDNSFQNDGQTAENDRKPRHIKRKRLKFQKTAYNRDARNHKQNDILFDPAERQQVLQFSHNPFHGQAPFIP